MMNDERRSIYPGDPELYTDDDDMIAHLLRDEWSLTDEYTPEISTDREKCIAYGDPGYIFVYPVSFYPSVASTDYQTAQVTSYLALRIASRDKGWMKALVRETERILIDYRRAGKGKIGYPWFEIIDRMQDNNSLGWYNTTLNLKFVDYCKRYRTSGFGTK